MTPHQLANAFFVACILLAFAGSAKADVVQCVDSAGAVTFTDVPCKIAADADRAAGSTDTASGVNGAVAPAGKFAAAEQAREVAAAGKRTPLHGLQLDVTTLKAARASMLSADRASVLMHQQAEARLN